MDAREKREFARFEQGAETIPAKHLNALADGLDEIYNSPDRLPLWKPNYETERDFPFRVSACVKNGKIEIDVSAGMWLGNGENVGNLQSDSWLLKGNGIGTRPSMKLSVAVAPVVWIVLSANISDSIIQMPEVLAFIGNSFNSGEEFGVFRIPIARIETTNSYCKVFQFLTSDFCFGASFSGGWSNSHPFKISYNAAKNSVKIKGGFWIGDGISARGTTAGVIYDNTNSRRDLRGMDTFRIDDTEFSTTDFQPSESIEFAVVAPTKFGRIIPGELTQKLYIRAFRVKKNKEEFDNYVLGMTPEVAFIGGISQEGEIFQTIRDNIHYSPSVPAGMPLHFYPKDEAPNTFECIGGLLMCNIPRTLNRDRMISAPEKVDTEELASQSVGGFRPAADPFGSAVEPIKTFTLQRRLVPIPRYEANLDGNSGSEYDANKTNGYVVALRVHMRYDLAADHDFYNGDNSPAFPRPEITWELIQIPKSNSIPQNMWEFGTELIPAGTEGSASCPSTFLGEMPGAPVELGIQGFGPVSEVDGWEYMQALALLHLVPTEEYESLIPIGIFYKPVRQDISATPSEDVSERRGRWLYMSLKRGIVEWTPPIDFKAWSQTVIG